MKSPWYVSLATLGHLGYTQGSGTWASLVTIPFAYMLSAYAANSLVHAILLAIVMMGTLVCVRYSMAFFPGDHDPSAIVIDEVIGCCIVWWALPWNAFSICVGFLLFRVLDITKPLGINRIENLKSPWGIVLDDVAAALVANGMLRLGYMLIES